MRKVLLAVALATAPLSGVGADLRLVVRNPLDIAITDAPVTSGVPWPRGLLASPDRMRLVDRLGEELPLQVEVFARWADGSIKSAFSIATSVAPPARQRASSSFASICTASSTVVGQKYPFGALID